MNVERACIIRLAGKALLHYLNDNFWCKVFLLFIFSFPLPLMVKDIQKPFLQPPQSCILSVQLSIRVLCSFFIIINAIETQSYKGLAVEAFTVHSVTCGIKGGVCHLHTSVLSISHYLDNVLTSPLCSFYFWMNRNNVFWDFGN